jgi:thiamine-phosphate pyrophosphorylase
VTDRTQTAGRELGDVLAALCRHGLRGVMLREKDLDPDALYNLAVKCRPVFDRHRVTWTVNGSIDVARRAGASGVHLTAAQDPAEARGALGASALVGKSVHGVDAAVAAEKAGADYILFGPVFETPAKARYGPPQGLDRLRKVCVTVAIPVFAVGGITPERAGECVAAGARGVAAISALMKAGKPEEMLAGYGHGLGKL